MRTGLLERAEAERAVAEEDQRPQIAPRSSCWRAWSRRTPPTSCSRVNGTSIVQMWQRVEQPLDVLASRKIAPVPSARL